MQSYGLREVEKLLRLPRSTVRALIEAGFVSPARGPRNAWKFSFQDLIVLRTARALVTAKVPARRITRSMRELRRHLPPSMPLSGLSIRAEGDRVVVKEGARRWHAESGQYLLAFEGDPEHGSLSVIEPRTAQRKLDAQELLDHGDALEHSDVEAALAAYRQAVALEPALVEAHMSLGWLLHESGRLAQAERAYRAGLRACGPEASLLFNLGVLLEDMGRKADAAKAYAEALEHRPDFADCHYNLALLCEALARPQDAIRHMAQYRRLVRSR